MSVKRNANVSVANEVGSKPLCGVVKRNENMITKRDSITKNTYIKLYSLLNDIQDENQKEDPQKDEP